MMFLGQPGTKVKLILQRDPPDGNNQVILLFPAFAIKPSILPARAGFLEPASLHASMLARSIIHA
jgi:hypothetical protein